MKITLKSPTLDLEIDNASSLDDIHKFIKQFLDLQIQFESAKMDVHLKAAAKAKTSKSSKRKTPKP